LIAESVVETGNREWGIGNRELVLSEVEVWGRRNKDVVSFASAGYANKNQIGILYFND